MKNVIVVSAGGMPYAIELGWIREVFTLGHVTQVPHAPEAIAGVVNFRGAIVSVIDLRKAQDSSQRGPACAHQGESALLIEVDRFQVALRVGNVDEVSSLHPAKEAGYLLDARERKVLLLKPEDLVERVQLNVNSNPLLRQ